MDATSQFDNKDELFKGKLFDFRGYRTVMNEQKINDTVEWGKKLLGPAAFEKEVEPIEVTSETVRPTSEAVEDLA